MLAWHSRGRRFDSVLLLRTRSHPLDIFCEMPIVFKWITPWRQPNSLRLKWSGTHHGAIRKTISW